MLFTRESMAPYTLSAGRAAGIAATISARVAQGDRAFIEGYALSLVASEDFEGLVIIGQNGLCTLQAFSRGRFRWQALACVPASCVGALRLLRNTIAQYRGDAERAFR